MVKNKEASWCISSRSPNGFCIFRNQQSTPIKTVLDKKNCVYKLNWSKQTAMVKDFLVEHFYSLFFFKKKKQNSESNFEKWRSCTAVFILFSQF